MIVKAIAIYQPWASKIASGEKTIETRTWQTRYRGELLIISTKRPFYADLPVGKALAFVDLVDCRSMIREDERAAYCRMDPELYSWVLGNIRVIKNPFDVIGRQGIFEVELVQTGRNFRVVRPAGFITAGKNRQKSFEF